MSTSEEFDSFVTAYSAWLTRTQALRLKLDRDLARTAFGVDLEHLIDYLDPVLAAAAQHSTRFDYPQVAAEYLHDIDKTREELESTPISDRDRQDYLQYLIDSQRLLRKLALLPVPPEGHLGFRGSALNAFRFLVEDYGFSISATSPISVRFITTTMFVDLSYSPECPMNSVVVGRRTGEGVPTEGFILDDFAYIAGLGVSFQYERYNLLGSAGLAEFLRTAAFLIREHGGALLRGDDAAYGEFQRKADERERSYVEMLERGRSGQR